MERSTHVPRGHFSAVSPTFELGIESGCEFICGLSVLLFGNLVILERATESFKSMMRLHDHVPSGFRFSISSGRLANFRLNSPLKHYRRVREATTLFNI